MRAWGSPNHGGRGVGILRLVRRYRDLFCADPRDKVYVLLEVSHLYPGVELPITYTISVLDVYKNLAKYVIAGSARLDILTYAGHDQCVSQNVLSWLPNWQHYDSLRRMVRVPWYASRNLSCVIQQSPDDNILITQVSSSDLALLETGNFYPQRRCCDSIDLALPAGGAKFSQWLQFITSNFHGSQSPTPSISKTHISIAFELQFYLVRVQITSLSKNPPAFATHSPLSSRSM